MSGRESKRAAFEQRSTSLRVYQPSGVQLVPEPGVYSNANALLIAVERIRPNPRNPRRTFPTETLDELAESIREKGILNPITVRRVVDAVAPYVIVAGDRRYRAALQIGLSQIPCIVSEMGEEDAYIASLIENLQREDLSPDEEASALQYLVVDRAMSVREVARLIHKSPTYVSAKVRIAQDAELLDAVRAGLPVSAAEKLLPIQDVERRRDLIAGFQRGEVKTQDLPRLLRPVAQRPAAPQQGTPEALAAGAGAEPPGVDPAMRVPRQLVIVSPAPDGHPDVSSPAPATAPAAVDPEMGCRAGTAAPSTAAPETPGPSVLPEAERRQRVEGWLAEAVRVLEGLEAADLSERARALLQRLAARAATLSGDSAPATDATGMHVTPGSACSGESS